MAEVDFQDLPTTASATLADVYAAIQSGSTVQISGQQIADLVKSDIILSYAGDPNGNLAGQIYELCWDTSTSRLYICTTSGTAATSVWELIAVVLSSDAATFLETPTSANLATLVTDETGSGSLVFGTSPTIGSPTVTSPTITGGSIDNTPIGDSTSTSGNFTDLTGDDAIFGDPGTEGSGIDINGTTYDSRLKVSNLGGSYEAQFIMHRHSTTLQPLIIGARSNSNDSSHSAVTGGQSLFTCFGAGWTDSHYDLFGSWEFQVDSAGTVSSTSAPGKWVVSVTPDGSQSPAAAFEIANDKAATFNGSLTINSNLMQSVEAGITASTTQTQGEGPLTKDINEISTCANSNDTVTLPSAVAGMSVLVINNGANTAQIFPASGDNLGAGVDSSTTLSTGASQRFTAYDATNWVQE